MQTRLNGGLTRLTKQHLTLGIFEGELRRSFIERDQQAALRGEVRRALAPADGDISRKSLKHYGIALLGWKFPLWIFTHMDNSIGQEVQLNSNPINCQLKGRRFLRFAGTSTYNPREQHPTCKEPCCLFHRTMILWLFCIYKPGSEGLPVRRWPSIVYQASALTVS